MMKKVTTVLALVIAGPGYAITESDRKLADEYLSLPSTIQLIEADPELTALSPEGMYDKLEEQGIIRDIKWRKHIKKFIENHPDYNKLLETHPEPMDQFPELKYFDLKNPQVIPGLPWEGANFGYDESIFHNNAGYPGTATCIAKVKGNVGWFKAGPHTLDPWDKVFPLVDCVSFQRKNKKDAYQCYIAGCTPTTAQPSTIVIKELIRDILLGKYN